MGSFSPMHWMIVALAVVLLFGGGRVSGLMGDLARGIKMFRKTMTEDATQDAEVPPPRIGANIAAPAKTMAAERASV
jgi:sec-independent protein translocase protein TatA